MKKIFVALVVIGTSITAICRADENNNVMQGVSFFSPRSQSVDAARAIVGWHPFTHRLDMKSCYVTIAGTPEYTKSFHADRIAQALFGTDTLEISGSQVENRGDQDILADYFGLSPEFQSTVILNPSIINFIFTLSAYVGFDGWVPGLSLSVFAPIVWTRWNFELQEDIINSSTVVFPANYMDFGPVTPPVQCFTQALMGGYTFGQMTQPMSFGRVCGPRSQWGVSDVQCILGYDVVAREHGYANINARLSIPTGTRPDCEFLFEPVIGNGKHWEFGLGFEGRVLVWEKDGNQELNVFGNLNFTHLFKSRQRRSFDFCQNGNGFGSRYILMKEFDSAGNYNGTLLPAINKTSLCCDVWVDLQFEALVMLGYTHKKFTFDLGYNGWLRSKEKINLTECIASNKYGLKGIQNVTDTMGNLINTTQSNATFIGNEFSDQAAVADTNSPIFVSTSDINVRSSGSPFVYTHKLFTNFSHAWQKSERDRIIPFLGIGTSVEFEGINNNDTKKPNRTTLSQWGVWLKGGCYFS